MEKLIDSFIKTVLYVVGAVILFIIGGWALVFLVKVFKAGIFLIPGAFLFLILWGVIHSLRDDSSI